MVRSLVLLAAGCLSLTTFGSPAIAQTPDCGDGITVGQVERPNVSGFLNVEIVGEDLASAANIRAEPTLESEVVLQVRVGDRLSASVRQYTPNSGGAGGAKLRVLIQAIHSSDISRTELI